jgi:DNA-binding NtrC family response regulator
MARTTEKDTIVLVDDEIHHLTWLIDYLYSKNLAVLPVDNANDAVEQISSEIYRALVVDLNIPLRPPLDKAAEALGAVYVRYPGLFVARHARNSGYRDRQVVIYSVHRDKEVVEEATKLGCTYILKGRPKAIKEELAAVLSFDPTDATSAQD